MHFKEKICVDNPTPRASVSAICRMMKPIHTSMHVEYKKTPKIISHRRSNLVSHVSSFAYDQYHYLTYSIIYGAAMCVISDVELKNSFKVMTKFRQMSHWDPLLQCLCLLP